VPERETLTSIDARTGAFAGINGGYFVIGDADGTPGDLAGISVLGGDLVSEAVAGRTSLVLPFRTGAGAAVAPLSTALSVRAADGARREIDGRNRRPGLIRACGGTGGDTPTEQPLHDITCTDPSELIQFTPAFGATSDPASEVEAVLDGRGRVVAVRPAGGPIPADGSVLGGTGGGAAWLREHARPGTRLKVDVRMTSGSFRVPLFPGLDVVNGGPRLLARGRPAITAAAEGFVHPDDPEFFYRFGVRRNPRTLAGVTRDGHLLLVAVDGRAPGYSDGLSFTESAGVMRALGARDALNLDGGGSTTFTLGTTLLTRPSDATGERPIGDAIVLLAGGDGRGR
jgi:phosphodiester glycosidase